MQDNSPFFGTITPPERNILRYVNGDEPESLDPSVSSGQPEARIYMALFEGLVEYDPKTLNPIPAIAERWAVNKDSSEFVFNLRRNARWSNGEAITARDFTYSIRRALSPQFASRNAYLGYLIKYAEAFNEGRVFVRDIETNKFLLEESFANGANHQVAPHAKLDSSGAAECSLVTDLGLSFDTPFHQMMHSPPRLTLPGSEKVRNQLLTSNPSLRAAVSGKEFVPVSAHDIGLEAVNDYTVRISLVRPAPFFTGLAAHQLFRIVPRRVIEEYGENWTDPSHIVTCGPFKVKSWKPQNELVVARDPMYWDAEHVGLDEIRFYPATDNAASMNLYKVGAVDAVLNHTVPNSWLPIVQSKRDYMDGAEASIVYILINVTRPPMNDLRVRRAFNMAIDKITYSKSRKITKPLSAFTPEAIFSGYPQPEGDGFDPEQGRRLLEQAGYPVTQDANGDYECKNFPIDEVEFVFNTASSNKAMAEFIQAQWKQNLGITVPLRSMDFRSFMAMRSKLEYKGFAIGIFGADYMDPFTFLGLFTTAGGDNGSGWFDNDYVAMLEEANQTLKPLDRYVLLAKAEKYLLDAQPIIPIETSSVNWVKKPYVKGMYPNAGSLYAWKFVYIERDPSRWE